MNFNTLIWKKLHSKIWFLVSVILIFLFATSSIIVTQVGLIRNMADVLLGGDRPILADDVDVVFTSDFANQDEVYAAANALNIEIAQEGFVMLTNEFRYNSTTTRSLPLARGNRVSVFGKNSVNVLLGGSGSGQRQEHQGAGAATIFDSLTQAGFYYNSALRAFYQDDSLSGSPRVPISGFGNRPQGINTAETPWGSYTSTVISSFSNYNDAALVVFSRMGGEGFDLPRRMYTDHQSGNPVQGRRYGARGNDQHYLQLDTNEVDLLLQVTQRFNNVVIIVNSNNILELGFLNEAAYWYEVFGVPTTQANNAIANIRSSIWIGSTGGQGIMALGSILNGDVNPSGRTVSTHSRRFDTDPVWQNFGDNRDPGLREGPAANRRPEGNAIASETGHPLAGAQRAYFVEYEEGIFLDYRYWETRAYEMRNINANWFNQHVVFPFGWGLSYSTFSWEIGAVGVAFRDEESGLLPASAGYATALSNDESLTSAHYRAYIMVDVTVTHQSGPAGKDVVQLYVQTPYTRGGIEKAHVVLMDFGKTGLLGGNGNPASQTLTLAFNMFTLASYDETDANQNGFIGWETEAGQYTIHVSRHSNSWQRTGVEPTASAATGNNAASLTHNFVVPAGTVSAAVRDYPAGASYGDYGNTGFVFRHDPFLPISERNRIVNRFQDRRTGQASFSSNFNTHFLTRADFGYADLETNPARSWPTPPTNEERRTTATQRNTILGGRMPATEFAAWDAGQPWYVPNNLMPNQGQVTRVDERGNANPIMLRELAGEPRYSDKWNQFLDQFTAEQMMGFLGTQAFGNQVGILEFGVPLIIHADGPAGFVNLHNDPRIHDYPNKTTFYVSHPIIAATFSIELAREFGRMIGNEAIIGDVRPESVGGGLPYTGWYAPGGNIHRSPFSGRNWEYFSADPILAGRIGAQVVAGAREFGVITFAKHFALNDQETDRSGNHNRGGLITWANEQSMREIYFRAFELFVKEGGSNGIMTAFNRVGHEIWAGGDYTLITELLRGEWGFVGVVITDFNFYPYMCVPRMIRAGGDIDLQTGNDFLTGPTALASATYVTAIRNGMKNYMYTLTRSNAMNVNVIGLRWSFWRIGLLWGNIGLVFAALVWGFFAVGVLALIKGTHELSKKKEEVAVGAYGNVEPSLAEEQKESVDMAETSFDDAIGKEEVVENSISSDEAEKDVSETEKK